MRVRSCDGVTKEDVLAVTCGWINRYVIIRGASIALIVVFTASVPDEYVVEDKEWRRGDKFRKVRGMWNVIRICGSEGIIERGSKC